LSKAKPFLTAELQRVIARWDDGGGVTAAVQAFAHDLPVAERTVWYWLSGERQIRPLVAERIKGLADGRKVRA
jgi:hypothetical protein